MSCRQEAARSKKQARQAVAAQEKAALVLARTQAELATSQTALQACRQQLRVQGRELEGVRRSSAAARRSHLSKEAAPFSPPAANSTVDSPKLSGFVTTGRAASSGAATSRVAPSGSSPPAGSPTRAFRQVQVTAYDIARSLRHDRRAGRHGVSVHTIANALRENNAIVAPSAATSAAAAPGAEIGDLVSEGSNDEFLHPSKNLSFDYN